MTKIELLEILTGDLKKMRRLENIAGRINKKHHKATKYCRERLEQECEVLLKEINNEMFLLRKLRKGINWDKEPEELSNEELREEQDLYWSIFEKTNFEIEGITESELLFLDKRGFYLDCEIHNREETAKKEKTFMDSLGENKEEFLKKIADTF